MKRLFTIHPTKGRIALTNQMVEVIAAIREQYGTVDLRHHQSGIGVYVPNWKA